MDGRVGDMTTQPTAERPTTSSTTTDPRPLYRSAQQWVIGLASAVRPDQLDRPTGCTEFDVRALLGHLVATVRRARGIGEGGGPPPLPLVGTGNEDEGGAHAYAAR